eukprot:2659375-Prymnesium_polylepis.1
MRGSSRTSSSNIARAGSVDMLGPRSPISGGVRARRPCVAGSARIRLLCGGAAPCCAVYQAAPSACACG